MTGLYGTPRTTNNDPRFSRDDAPAGAFSPNAAAVWAVLDRLSWLTMTDARQLSQAVTEQYGHDHSARSEHTDDAYLSAEAARAAGDDRFADWKAIETLIGLTEDAVCPEDAAWVSGQYSKNRAVWCNAFGAGRNAAWALLVADRPEFPPTALEWMTGPWLRFCETTGGA